MAFSFIFGGVRSEYKNISVNAIRRSMLQPIAPRTISVPDRVGIYFFKNDITERTIEVDITLHEASQTILRERIEDISIFLDPTKGTQSLIFDDYPERTYFAVLSDKTDFNQILALGQGTLIFLVPDGVSYSSTSITQNCNTVPKATFSRTTAAYLEDGSSVGGSVQRYEPCAFGQGIRIEESTINLINATMSSFESGVGTAVGNGPNDVVSQSYTFSHHGIASCMVITGGIQVHEGLFSNYNQTVLANTTYTMSVYVMGNGPFQIQWDEYTAASAFIRTDSSATFTPNLNGFTRFTFTQQVSGTCDHIIWAFRTPQRVTATFYFDSIQLEQKPYATGWHIGGSSRNAELMTIFTREYLFGQQGTIDFFFKKTGSPGPFGGMFDWGRFSANSSRDRLAIIHGTCVGGQKSIQFVIASSATAHATTLTLTLPSTLVVDRVYYLAVRWYLDGTLANSFMKINLADLTNNVEYKTSVATTQAGPVFPSISSAYVGSLRAGVYWSNCIYDELRLTGIARNDTQITDAWELRRTLVKDQIATVKYNFDSTLAGTVISNQGTAPVDPIVKLTFRSNTTNPTLIQWTPGASSMKITFQTSGKYTAGTWLQIDSLNRKVTSTTGFVINNRVQLLSDFPRITGDHYYTVTPTTNTDIRVTYTPRWL